MDLYPGSRPCVGCGYCCRKAPCAFSPSDTPPCPELIEVDGRWRCGKVLRLDGAAREILMDELAVGAGCCSPLNSDRRKYLERA